MHGAGPATINFQAGATQRIANISGATFDINPPSGNINIFSQTPGSYWLIDLEPLATIVAPPATVSVTVDWSQATPYDIPVPPTGYILTAPAPTRCPGWKNVNAVTGDATQDVNSNGKIDRILVTTQFNLTRTVAAFSGFVVQIAGYTLDTLGGERRGVPVQLDRSVLRHASKPVLDHAEGADVYRHGSDPVWTVTVNNTLNDSGSGVYYVPTGSYTPSDTAPPVVGYTLAVVGNSQDLRALLRAVFHVGGGGLVTSDFTFTPATMSVAGITPVTSAGGGISEALLTLNRAITADDVILPTMMHVAAQDAATPVNAITIPALGHRVSDIGLGQLTDGMDEPVFVHDETVQGSAAAGIGLIQTGGSTDPSGCALIRTLRQRDTSTLSPRSPIPQMDRPACGSTRTSPPR